MSYGRAHSYGVGHMTPPGVMCDTRVMCDAPRASRDPPPTCDDKDPSLTHCVHSCMATLAACSTAMRSANAIGRPSLQTSWPPPPLPRPPLYLRANQHKPRHLHRLGERQLQQAALGLIVLHHPVAPVDVYLLEELAIDDECLAGRQRAHLCSAQ